MEGCWQRSLQPPAFICHILDQFTSAPRIVTLERIGRGDLLGVLQIRSAD
jgi:hypothetical protein